MSWLKRPILAACTVSIVGHVLLAWSSPEHTARPRDEASVQLEFTLASAPAPQPAPNEPTLAPASTEEPTQRREVKTVRPSERRSEPGSEIRVAEQVEPSRPAPDSAQGAAESAPAQPAAQPSPAPSPGRIDLSPRAAAATLNAEIEKQLVAGSCSTSRGVGPDCRTGAAAVAAARVSERGAGARLPGSDAYLLEPARGGGYVHRSPGFNARIEPNGDVHFDDKLRDLNDLVTSLMSEQAYTAQKRRFLAQTAELRDQLAAEARANAQLRGLGELAHQLQRILADASRSGLQKRIAIFALWDDCANDTLGAEAQQKIERFVRDHLPAEGPLAYSMAELAELNRRRASKRTFAPYAAADAGVRPG